MIEVGKKSSYRMKRCYKILQDTARCLAVLLIFRQITYNRIYYYYLKFSAVLVLSTNNITFILLASSKLQKNFQDVFSKGNYDIGGNLPELQNFYYKI